MPSPARLLAAAAAMAAAAAWGQAAGGRDLFTRPDKGNCIACHQVPEGSGPAVRADVGPRLDAARLKGWDRERLSRHPRRSHAGNPDSVMPPYGRHHLLDAAESTASSTFSMRFPDHGPFLALLVLAALPLQALAGAEQVRADIASRVRSQYPALSPAELASGSAAFDPTRQALAERNNPVPGAAEAIEAGRRIWTRKFAKGRSLAGCFPNGGRRIAGATRSTTAGERIVTLETAINQCLKTHGQPPARRRRPPAHGCRPRVPALAVEGQKIAVRVSRPSPRDRFEEGRRASTSRHGPAELRVRVLPRSPRGKFFGDAAIRRRWAPLRNGHTCATAGRWTLQMRVRECLDRMGAAPFPAGSDELAYLEYFLAYLSNGIAIRPNTWRPR